MSEGALKNPVMLALSRVGTTIFRQNVGQGVVGRIMWIRKAMTVSVGPGDCVVRGARVLHAGLCKGSGDFIGWTPTVVTQEMVGQTIAVFTSVETKDKGPVEPEQANFAARIVADGGYAGIARSVADALAIVRR